MKRLLCALALLGLLTGCSFFAEEKTYEWQKPHDTYQVGSFSKSQNAEDLKEQLKRAGFDSRIETEIKNGVFYLNVLVDVYEQSPDVASRLEKVSGAKPILRVKRSGG